MKTYEFEYTDTKHLNRLMVSSFIIFLLLLICMSIFFDTGNDDMVNLIIPIGIPLLIFVINIKKIKKQGTATIHDSYTEFELSDTSFKINYKDIVSYQITRYTGITFIIKLKDDEAFKLRAESHFSDSQKLDDFCQAFESTIEMFKASNIVELSKKLSNLEKPGVYPIIIITTIVLLLLISYAFYKGFKIPIGAITTLALCISIWAAYLSNRRKKQEQEN